MFLLDCKDSLRILSLLFEVSLDGFLIDFLKLSWVSAVQHDGIAFVEKSLGILVCQ